jgi:hypothetical protein
MSLFHGTGESREHVYLRGSEDARRTWLYTPAFVIESSCTVLVFIDCVCLFVLYFVSFCLLPDISFKFKQSVHPKISKIYYFHVSICASLNTWRKFMLLCCPQDAAPEQVNVNFVVPDQRDPTLPTSHTRDFTMGK